MNGKWKQTRTDKFEDYLKELGVNVVKRKLVLASSPAMEINIDEAAASVNVKTSTTFSKHEIQCTAGTDFETDMPGVVDGKFNGQCTIEGGKVIVVLTPTTAQVKGTTTTREMVGDELKMTMVCGGTTCERFFAKDK